jgi:hypothetical protein
MKCLDAVSLSDQREIFNIELNFQIKTFNQLCTLNNFRYPLSKAIPVHRPVPVLLEQRQIHLRSARPDPVLSLPTMSHSAASEIKHRPFLSFGLLRTRRHATRTHEGGRRQYRDLLGHPGKKGHLSRQFPAVADCLRNIGPVEVHSPELRSQVSGGEHLENY